ncbi:hypothetical protein HSR122_1522 [Halapricum desulfuricans]|uniref:Uncharacterized protein n=1 Tax=Halapricum desulfuricans TaxID=2841257 RepID=A0A897N8T8_9EURY|nr:hypothetical protein HSR122_1522 [Halapricum desulfuricans]
MNDPYDRGHEEYAARCVDGQIRDDEQSNADEQGPILFDECLESHAVSTSALFVNLRHDPEIVISFATRRRCCATHKSHMGI